MPAFPHDSCCRPPAHDRVRDRDRRTPVPGRGVGGGGAHRLDPRAHRRRARAGDLHEPRRAGQDPARTQRGERPERRHRHPVRRAVPDGARVGGGRERRRLADRGGQGDRTRRSSSRSASASSAAGSSALLNGAARPPRCRSSSGSSPSRCSRTSGPWRSGATASSRRSSAAWRSAPRPEGRCVDPPSSPRRWGCSPRSSCGRCSARSSSVPS